MTSISLADAKARLSELVDRVESGASIAITRRGKPVAQLSAIGAARKPIDLAALQAMVEALPVPRDDAENIVRSMRDDDRY